MPVIAHSTAAMPLANAGPMLRVWSPDAGVDAPSEHRIKNPVLGQTRRKGDAAGQKEIWPTAGIDPAVTAEAARLTQQFASPTISEDQRVWLRANLSLKGFYLDWMLPDRQRRFELGQLKAATLEKDMQALNRWEAITRPSDWPVDREWPGVPIGFTSGPIVSHFFERMRAAGYADGTIVSTKTHLTTILHCAERLRLVEPIVLEPLVVERTDNRFLTDDEAARAFQMLASRPDLQVAFVLSLATGARPIDLFCFRCCDLRLDKNPIIRFNAEKTGMHLSLPLAPHVVSHLKRLPLDGTYLFPGLGSPEAKKPESSTVSRRRKTVLKSLLMAAGVFDVIDGQQVEINCPHQVCRSTASLWIERVKRGMSSTLLGHADDDTSARRVTRIHYLPTEMEPSPDLIEAVRSVKWPDVFLQG